MRPWYRGSVVARTGSAFRRRAKRSGTGRALPGARGENLGLLLAAVALLPAAARAAQVGPDAFGYTWWDSNSAGPAYNYEIDNNATALVLDDDGISPPLGLPFPFVFYGATYNELRVHSNGAVTFVGSEPLGPEHTCPVEIQPVPTIAALWSDLDPRSPPSGGGVYPWTRGEAPDRVFVIEWFEIPPYGLSGTFTFEIKLFEADSHIEIHYDDLDSDGSEQDNGARAAVAISAPARLLAVSCNTASVVPNIAIGFFPPGCDDADGDGVCADEDCDDDNADVYPGAAEICDLLDTDCDGFLPVNERDQDDDGFALCQGDCDDGDENATPIDLDGDGASGCDGDCDDGDPALNVQDEDGDGVSTCDGDCEDNVH